MLARPPRRYAARTQINPTGTGLLSHTSANSTVEEDILNTAPYLNIHDGSLRRAEETTNTWINEIYLQAKVVRHRRVNTQRKARETAYSELESLKVEQRNIRTANLAERQERAAQLAEIQEDERKEVRRRQEQVQRESREREAAAQLLQQQAVEAAESYRRARLRSCPVCLEDGDFGDMVSTSCDHWYCPECLKAGFEASFASRSIFQCCQIQVDVKLVAEFLTCEFVASYALLCLERTTLNPTYCAHGNCGAFIPPARYHGPDSAECPRCFMETCRHCRAMDHAPLGCIADPVTEKVRKLASKQGWMPCPTCHTMVEKIDGCVHITCECKTEFCYRCGGIWEVCKSDCRDRQR